MRVHKRRFPSYIQIEPSGECSLRCRMCVRRYRNDRPAPGQKAFMPFDLFTRILSQCRGVSRVHLQGLGEPLLHPRFYDMAAAAASRGFAVTLNTNLMLADAQAISECTRCGLTDIYVSVDGATRKTYESIRVNARFDLLRENLALLMRSRRNGMPRVRLATVALRKNLHELPLLASFAGRLGLRSLHVQHLFRDFSSPTLSRRYPALAGFFARETLLAENERRVRHYFDRAREQAGEWGVELHLPKVRPAPGMLQAPVRTRCDWPWRGAYITYRGEVKPCCMSAAPGTDTLGSAAGDRIGTIWNSAGYRQFRKKISSDDPPAVCRSCSMYHGIF